MSRIIADTDALVGLGSINQDITETIFSDMDITVSGICYKELRNKYREGDDPSLRDRAKRAFDCIERDQLEGYPGKYRAGEDNAGEKSIRTGVNQDNYDVVLLYDCGAIEMLSETKSKNDLSFSIEPPNYPLIALCEEGYITKKEAKNQTQLMLNETGWINSEQKDLFWQYPQLS
jgi:hypothetical protein